MKAAARPLRKPVFARIPEAKEAEQQRADMERLAKEAALAELEQLKKQLGKS